MKAKEAFEIMQGVEELSGELPEDGLLVEEALRMAIEALEKQIPKKFKMADDNYTPICPVCGETILDMRWCDGCGQRLDVDEED